MSPATSSSSVLTSSTIPEYGAPSTRYGVGNYVPAVPYSSASGYTQQYATSEYPENVYSMSNDDVIPREATNHYVDSVPTKMRKIIIRQLQPWANVSNIRDLIRHVAGSDAAGKLQKFDMPMADGQQGLHRGYALATFESEEAADKVIKRLNNYKYDGRVLEVRHTKEGISDISPSHFSRSSRGCGNQRQSNNSHHSHSSRRDRRDDKGKKGKDKESSHKGANSGGKGSKSPVIANGTTRNA